MNDISPLNSNKLVSVLVKNLIGNTAKITSVKQINSELYSMKINGSSVFRYVLFKNGKMAIFEDLEMYELIYGV